jgi:hypothetical protein
MTVDILGNLYVWDYDASNPRIVMRTPQGVWSVIASQEYARGRIDIPVPMTTDGSGHLFIAEAGPYRAGDFPTSQVRMRSPEGIWSVIAPEGDGPGQVVRPTALATDGQGNLFVLEGGNKRVQMRNSQGVWSVIASTGPALDQVSNPTALAVDDSGRLYVADGINQRVQNGMPGATGR